MKFYAVGYTNGGANEKRLGPFGSIDEARRNGISEMNRNRGAFSFSGVVDESGKCVFTNSCSSTNPVVQNALAVAANAGDKKCKVTLETVTFNQGVKPETRHMSIPELRTLLKMLGKGSDADSFIQRLETGGATDIAINDVDLYAALI